ncbi:HlyD family secretion protein [Chloroflexota bacterium]
MKSWPIVIVLLLCLVLVGSLSCSPTDAKEQETLQQTVEQDELTITVSGSGNIEVSNELKLTFGVAGKVDKIYVEEGDNVTEGEVLAKLETDALELALNKEQVVLNQAHATHNQAQVAVTQANTAVTQAQATVTQAEIALQTAEYTLGQTEETYTLSDIKAAQSNVDAVRRDWEEALQTLYKYDPGTPGWEEYQEIVNQAQLRLNAAEDRLDAILFGNSTEEVAIKKLQVEAAQQSLKVAQQSVEPAQQSVELAQQSLEIAKRSVELARQSVELAQKQLDEATITAPFDGLVASVSVDEGDTVSTAITIVHLIDPNSMELNVEVDEIDIPEVKLGQRAIIEIDALPDLPLEGKVSSISLLPTIETGLIMYDVKIEFDVLDGIGLRTGMSATADIVIAE